MEKTTVNEARLEAMRQHFIDIIEDKATSGDWSDTYGDANRIVEQLRSGSKIRWHNRLYSWLVMAGQSFGLTPDEIDSARDQIFEAEERD